MDKSDWVNQMVECLSMKEANPEMVQKALDLKYANRPKSIFKYRAMDDQDYALKNLESDRVWVSSPTAYNDPYDSGLSISTEILMSGLVKNAVRSIIEVNMGDLITPAIKTQIMNSENPALALQNLFMAKDELTEQQQVEYREMLKTNIQALQRSAQEMLPESYKPSLKICSFSETPDSIVMWSHYGDQHRGFCIEYDIKELSEETPFIRMLFPIIYSEKFFDATPYYQAVTANKTGFNTHFPLLAALHKSPEWAYEREWRLVISASMVKNDLGFAAPKAKTVFLGHRMSEAHRAKVRAICESKGIEVRVMAMKKDCFSLTSVSV